MLKDISKPKSTNEFGFYGNTDASILKSKKSRKGHIQYIGNYSPLELKQKEADKKIVLSPKISDTFSDVGTHALNALKTFGGSVIGDAVNMASPKAAQWLEQISQGIIPYTKLEQFEKNRSSDGKWMNKNRWSNRSLDVIDGFNTIVSGEIAGVGMNYLGKGIKPLGKSILAKGRQGVITSLPKPAVTPHISPQGIKSTITGKTPIMLNDKTVPFDSSIPWTNKFRDISRREFMSLNENNFLKVNPKSTMRSSKHPLYKEAPLEKGAGFRTFPKNNPIKKSAEQGYKDRAINFTDLKYAENKFVPLGYKSWGNNKKLKQIARSSEYTDKLIKQRVNQNVTHVRGIEASPTDILTNQIKRESLNSAGIPWDREPIKAAEYFAKYGPTGDTGGGSWGIPQDFYDKGNTGLYTSNGISTASTYAGNGPNSYIATVRKKLDLKIPSRKNWIDQSTPNKHIGNVSQEFSTPNWSLSNNNFGLGYNPEKTLLKANASRDNPFAHHVYLTKQGESPVNIVKLVNNKINPKGHYSYGEYTKGLSMYNLGGILKNYKK